MAKKARRTTFAEQFAPLQFGHKKCVDDVDRFSILIADDDAFNRNVLKDLLQRRGLNSLEASDGKEAVGLIDRYVKSGTLAEINIIFMDLQMPNMDGIEAATTVQSLCRQASMQPPPIIGLSGDSSEEDRKMFQRAGIAEFVSKPVTNAKLRHILGTYLCKHSN